MGITLRALTHEDIEAHNAGEDDATVHWLSGTYGTVESTAAHFDRLAANARAGSGKRGFGVFLDNRLAGYVDLDPAPDDGLEPGDVNISYAVHPWARGRGLAGEAVRLICDHLREHRIGTRAAIRVYAGNHASVRVAEKSGFTHTHDVVAGSGEPPAPLRIYVYDL